MQKGRKAKRTYVLTPSSFFLVFGLLALFSVVGLDYIGWRKGEKSYLFASFAGKGQASPAADNLEQVILEKIASHGIPSESIQQYRDNKGVLHLMVNLSLSEFGRMESDLLKEFPGWNASVVHREAQEGEDKSYYLWHVDGDPSLIILFSCTREKPAGPSLPAAEARNKVAIIVDDMGYSLKAIRDICSLKKPVTVSVLPFSPLARETAQIAHQNGLEVMLHLPLESIWPEEHNDMEGTIRSRMSEEEIIETLEAALDQLPYIRGVNNHMGSKITADRDMMRVILQRLKSRRLFFIDSQTTARSVAYKTAQELKIPSAYRHVFLDGEANEDYIKGKLLELFRLARRNGKAVGICHPREETLKVLKENFHLVEKYQLEPVFASQIVQ